MKKDEQKYDISGLAEDLGVEIEDIKELYYKYFDEMEIETFKMKEYMRKQDWGMLERVVHNIKGVSISLNINDVYAKAAEFDALLKNNETESAGSNISGLIELIRNAEQDIKEFFIK